MLPSNGRLIVVCGLAAEAKIATGADRDLVVIAGGGKQSRLAAELDVVAQGASGILSFGVAGGLAPGLKPGDVRVADLVIGPDGTLFTPDPIWATAIRSKLASEKCYRATVGSLMVRRAKPVSNHEAVPAMRPAGTLVVRDAPCVPHHEGDGAALDMALARFACVDTPLADIAGKAALHRTTGADLVDMETHIVAQAAANHGVPFAALRAVTDSAHRSLPHAATVGMRADGTVDLAAIFRSLAQNPGQLPGLIRTGLDARAAFASLFRCRQLLGSSFALVDLRETRLDVT